MKTNEMIEEVTAIKNSASEDICAVILKYAKESNPYSVGDIIEDHYQIGKITKIIYAISQVSESFNFTYKCVRLKKNLKPFKSGETTNIYYPNVIKKH